MPIENCFFHTGGAEEAGSRTGTDILIGVDAKNNLAAFEFPPSDLLKDISIEGFSGFFDPFLFSKVPSVLLIDRTWPWTVTGFGRR